MSKKSTHDDAGNIKGAQQHAEGQHGDKAHARFLEQLHEGTHDDRDDNVIASQPTPGKHRLSENREQHDEADLRQDKTHASRHGIDYVRHSENDTHNNQ